MEPGGISLWMSEGGSGGGSAGGRGGAASTSMCDEVTAGLGVDAGVGWQSRSETDGVAVVMVDHVDFVVVDCVVVAKVGTVVHGI
jgi:hypothetical protein